MKRRDERIEVVDDAGSVFIIRERIEDHPAPVIEPIRKPSPRIRERKPLRSKPHVIPFSVKQAVFERDQYECRWCESPGGALDAHHVTRRSQGGKDSVDNLVSVHRICHRFIHEHPSAAKARGFLS